ncbi:hypothetical protein DFH09DRAFT_1108526 [Mycena vulgaris]|nr:hypothetical protein DFH09DRAFT_1108526 [Mycena vulgaris]
MRGISLGVAQFLPGSKVTAFPNSHKPARRTLVKPSRTFEKCSQDPDDLEVHGLSTITRDKTQDKFGAQICPLSQRAARAQHAPQTSPHVHPSQKITRAQSSRASTLALSNANNVRRRRIMTHRTNKSRVKNQNKSLSAAQHVSIHGMKNTKVFWEWIRFLRNVHAGCMLPPNFRTGLGRLGNR